MENPERQLNSMARRFRNSSFLLIAANIIPLIGVLLLGWDLFLVLALFWLENLVIGLFGIVRVIFLTRDTLRKRLASAVFFVIHYGGFMFGHAMLLLSVFGESANVDGGIEDFAQFLDYLMRPGIGVAILALFVSHGWSFFESLNGGGQERAMTAGDAMALPYRRIVITQVGLIVGALLVERLDEPLAGLVALVAVKILLDLQMQRKEQEKLARQSTTFTPPASGNSRPRASVRDRKN